MEKLGLVLGALGTLLLITIILAWPNMWLWNNALVGAVDGINPIGFWQSLGITFLFNSLFKSNSSK
jgi:hypothetical protein